jgi:hypothetical protein
MVTAKLVAPPAAFSQFLYAFVGDDANGMELTLLSALARQNMDPWQKAADLSQLPGCVAMRALETLLKSVPGHESPVERTALAGRLLSLLPHPVDIKDRGANPSCPPAPARSDPTTELTLVLLYFMAMLVCGWWFSDRTPAEASAQPPAAGAPVAAERAPSILPGR